MFARHRLLKKLYFLLFASVFFYGTGSLISFLHQQYNTPSRIADRLSKEIGTAEKDLNKDLTFLLHRLESSKKPISFDLWKEIPGNFSEEGKLFLVYRDKKLLLWSNNAFQAGKILDKDLDLKSILFRGNGYYLKQKLTSRHWTLIGLQLVKYQYNFSNEYLPGGFFKTFKVPEGVSISLNPGQSNVTDAHSKFLFSISVENQDYQGIYFMLMIFTLYVSSFLCLVSALFCGYTYLLRWIRHRSLMLLLFVLDALILRYIFFYFRIPGYLYSSELFSPTYYASSDILPSLGDLLINTLLFLQLSYFLNKYFRFSEKKILSRPIRWGLAILSVILALIFFGAMIRQINDLVINSNIPLHFDRFLNLTPLSGLALFVISSLLLSFYLLSDVLSRAAIRLLKTRTSYFLILGLFIGVFYFVFPSSLPMNLIPWIGMILFLALRGLEGTKFQKGIFKMASLAMLLLILSSIATYQVNQLIQQREEEQRKILASHLSDSRDKLAEYVYRQTASSIRQDKKINEILEKAGSDSLAEKELLGYLNHTYFQRLRNKYNLQYTLCWEKKKLSIKPENLITDCESFFQDHIRQSLQLIDSSGLYFMKQSVDITYYLGKIELKRDSLEQNKKVNLYVELDARNSSLGLGYPELLMDKSLSSTDNHTGYSYAIYIQDELVRNVGKYFYDIENQKYKRKTSEDYFLNSNGYSHLVHTIDDKTKLVVSLENPGIAVIIAPFSFIILILALMWLVLLTIPGNTLPVPLSRLSFGFRLQVFMVSLILVSSILIGGVTLIYLKQLNYNKNKDIVSEKMNTILVELENRFGNSPPLTPANKDDLIDQLLYLANSNFTDIHVFGIDGTLIASSRNELFTDGLMADLMNPNAMRNLVNERKSFFMQDELIGKYKYLSVYAPLRNYNNQLIGYLNLPYFARQEDLRLELSRLMATYANIYILMIALAVLLALVISRYITRPLQLISNQLGNFSFGTVNAKIDWSRSDEIGRLVNEYNRMIDELAVSAELLARSERETAWREMARQVAHEIKNPLTPIKLSIQHLIRAWDDKAPDWEARLKRFSQTLIMQIDTLSAIATEFSDFAQMPQSNIKRIDIQSVIANSAQLFRDHENLSIHYPQHSGHFFVLADENQMIRVFNNLIKNAIQAIPVERKGEISITLEAKGDHCLIVFSDNGSGIPDEQQTRIFSPNFTTKSAGMGLGLAMVKNIVDNSGGRIWFESVPDKGTTFYIVLPASTE